MDPNHWNYNPAYSRISPGSLPSSHGAINRIDFSLLDQATLSSGLSLPSLSSHANLTSRGIGTLPGMNYVGHPLHSTVPQFLEPMAQLSPSFSGQPTYKPMPMSQSPFPFESPGRSSTEMPASYSSSRYSTSTPSHSKPHLFSPSELPSPKELASSFSPPSQNLEPSSKGWGLSNFLSGPSTFGGLPDSSPSDFSSLPQTHLQQTPPPAHSSTNRLSAVQRNPYAETLFPESSRQIKTPQPLLSPKDHLPFTSSSGNYGRISDIGLSSKSSMSVSTPQSYTVSPPEIEDLSAHSNSHSIYNTYISSAYSVVPENTPSFSSSTHMSQDIEYEPVSPATTLSEAQQSSDNNPFSFHDFGVLGSPQGPVHEKPAHSDRHRESLIHQEPMLQSPMDESNCVSKESSQVSSIPSHMTMQHTPPGIHNGQNMNSSPMQQSPISVGSPQVSMSVSSPQLAMPLGSPQSLLPSSTVGPAPPPVQAIADSTTKPKRGRGSRGGRGAGSRGGRGRRKKSDDRDSFLGELHQPALFPNELAQQHPPQPFNDMNQQRFMQDSHDMNSGYMHSDMSPMVDPALVQRQMSGDQMQRSPLEENLACVQQQIPDPMTTNARLQSLSEELLSRHSSVSSLNSGHQPSPGQEVMAMNTQTYCEPIVSGQHPSPVTDPSPTNQIPMESSQMVRNTDSSSLTSHSGMSDSSMDQRSSVLTAVRETDVIMNASDQYNMNGFVDQPFIDQLASTPPSVSQSLNYQGNMVMPDKSGMMSPELNPDNYQDALSNGMHMQQFNNYPLQQEQQPLADLDVNSAGSTIDEATFSSLLYTPQPDRRHRTKAEQKMPVVTVTPQVEEDEELAHLSQPPPSVDENFSFKEEDKKGKAFGSSFQDSFLNYIMGKKQETLESLSSATVHKKPQLPKYIPEPRRPRPQTPPVSSRDASNSDNNDSSDEGVSDSDSIDSVTKTVQNVITQFSDDDSKDRIVKSKDLKMKITLKRTPEGVKVKNIKTPKSKSKGRGKEGRRKNASSETVIEDSALPPRERISRRAKDRALEKKRRNSSASSSDEDDIKSINPEPEEEKDYDSDKDPAWTPFEVDVRQPTFDDAVADKPRRARRASIKSGRSHRPRSLGSKNLLESTPVVPAEAPESPPAKVTKLSPPASAPSSPTREVDPSSDSFAIGKFIIEKKDMNNYESFPIWKIEQGRMIHKFEIFLEEGNLRHKAVSTYSSWMTSMKDQFFPVEVKLISKVDTVEIVEVTEECRPKPPTDGSLETKYEDDPLVNLFNVYLQIFLSQALERGFLSAITDAQENFYLSALEKIDKLISKKLEEIDKKIKWRPNFKESLKAKPQLREIDRPNLKQSCQACEHSSPPTIKTVHFLGTPYDRFDLDELPERKDVATEFMIGKTAAQYVGTYHSLHHFKYNLYKRCLAKVKLLKDSDKGISNEKLLDQCLHNRAWVLKIFEDLKRLLEKG